MTDTRRTTSSMKKVWSATSGTRAKKKQKAKAGLCVEEQNE